MFNVAQMGQEPTFKLVLCSLVGRELYKCSLVLVYLELDLLGPSLVQDNFPTFSR